MICLLNLRSSSNILQGPGVLQNGLLRPAGSAWGGGGKVGQGKHEAEAQLEVPGHPVQTHCRLNPSIFNSVLHNGDPYPISFVN